MSFEGDTQLERNKRKHITLTIQQKLEIINLIELGQSRQAIATKYGVGKTTVHDIYKRKDRIRDFAMQKTDFAKRRRLDVSLEKGHVAKQEFQGQPQEDEFDIREIVVEEETLVENFDHEEFDYPVNEQEYEIVYEPPSLELSQKSLSELPLKQSNNTAASVKRRSKTLTLREKYDVLKQVENGESVPKICQRYEIGRTTVYDYIKNKERIFEYIEKSCNENRKTFKKSNYPEIENKMKAWCDLQEAFTKQQFFEKCKLCFAQQKQTGPSQFCGSWSWCKRFFERYPEFKQKIILPRGDFSLSINLKSEVESFGEDMDPENAFSNSGGNYVTNIPSKRQVKYLNLSEKLDVLNDLATGQTISSVADKWSISKSTAYDILKRQEQLHQLSSHAISEEKVPKSPNYQEIENNLSTEALEPDFEPDFLPIENEEEQTEDDDAASNNAAADGEEYIVEELEPEIPHENDFAKYEEELHGEEEELYESMMADITDEEALQSLKVLIRYSARKGHDDISNLLLEYQNILEDEMS